MKITPENVMLIEDRLRAILYQLQWKKTLFKDIVELDCHLKQAVWDRLGFCEVWVQHYDDIWHHAHAVTLVVSESGGTAFAVTHRFSYHALELS